MSCFTVDTSDQTFYNEKDKTGKKQTKKKLNHYFVITFYKLSMLYTVYYQMCILNTSENHEYPKTPHHHTNIINCM